jgi:glycine/D-amino acid oxidase-like deaminating enzyme
VTGDSFGWIGGGTPLRRMALEDWARLEREVAGVSVRWSGSLALSETDRLGPGERLVDAAEIARLEPSLRLVPPRAVHRRADGAVDPVAVTEALVGAARRHGAEARFGEAVERLRVRAGAVAGVETAAGSLACGTVVLAAGVGAASLVELPVDASPSVLARLTGPPGLVRTIVSGPEIEVRQTADGGLLFAADLERDADVIRRRVQQHFAGAEGVEVVDVRVGMRPMPADGLPVIGPLPGHAGAYVAVMHSGVTLAAVAGRLIAAELAGGRPARPTLAS